MFHHLHRLLHGAGTRPTPHGVLDVGPEPDRKEVKKNFREIAKNCHPDVTDDPYRHHLFFLASEAYHQFQAWWAEEDAPDPALEYIENHPGCTSSEVLENTDFTVDRKRLKKLESNGEIENRGRASRHAWYAVAD